MGESSGGVMPMHRPPPASWGAWGQLPDRLRGSVAGLQEEFSMDAPKSRFPVSHASLPGAPPAAAQSLSLCPAPLLRPGWESQLRGRGVPSPLSACLGPLQAPAVHRAGGVPRCCILPRCLC